MRDRREIELLIEFMKDARNQSPYWVDRTVDLKDATDSLCEVLLWTTGVPVERLDAMVARQRREQVEKN